MEISPVAAQVIPEPVSPSTLKSEEVKVEIRAAQISSWLMSAVTPAFWQAS